MGQTQGSNNDAAPAPLRLAPEMASLRLQVLAFTRAYILRWGEGPSYDEIAHATGTHRMRVKRIVGQLITQGMLLRAQGVRGLMLPDRVDEALRLLRELGWTVDAAAARLEPPAPDQRVTNRSLQTPDGFDYDISRLAIGRCRNDGAEETQGTDGEAHVR